MDFKCNEVATVDLDHVHYKTSGYLQISGDNKTKPGEKAEKRPEHVVAK